MAAVTVTRALARKPNSREGYERCLGEVSGPTRKWAERQGKTPRCSFHASYVVNGVRLCDRHAGKRLLTLMLREEERREHTGTWCPDCGEAMAAGETKCCNAGCRAR